jgi:putative SbcD/Mre11-related phosphoesterase
MSIRFINKEPALLIRDKEHGRILVIGDLHLGIEHELYKDGITIAPQAEKLYNSITRLIKMSRAEKLVILGDLKHKIPGISFRELKQIPKFMIPIARQAKVYLARGNHDTELEGLYPKSVTFSDAGGFQIGKYGFFHGHAWPDKELLECDHLFTAHIHPTVEFIDDFGFRIVEKVWVRAKPKLKVLKEKYKIGKKKRGKKKSDEPKFDFGELDTIIFPSFNPIISGFPLNSSRRRGKKYVGVLFRSGAVDVKKAETFLLDGTPLGEVRKIKNLV